VSGEFDWLFAYLVFGLLFVIVVLVVQLVLQRRQVIALSRRLDQLTAGEAHEAAVPRTWRAPDLTAATTMDLYAELDRRQRLEDLGIRDLPPSMRPNA
jgi:Tfp pilus assembly protein PilO